MRTLFLIKLLGLALIVGACSSKESNQPAHRTEIMVKTYTVAASSDNNEKEYIGIVEEDVSASMSFPLNGTIDKINAVEGQEVKKGELLAELNAYSLKNTHNAARATLKQAEDGMKRLQSLYDKNSLPEIQYIEMQTNLEKARAAEAIARRNLENSRLVAPFSGIVGSKMVDVGENVLPNQAVLTLLQIDRVEAKIAVPEKEINTIQVGQSATVRVSAANGELFSGKISKKGVVADPISHTYPVRISVDNADNVLLPGMVCNITMTDNTDKQSIVIPNQCVLKDGNGKIYVWKVLDGYSRKQMIETGKQKAGGVEVLNGLSVGDEIISEGYQKVSNGLKVTVL